MEVRGEAQLLPVPKGLRNLLPSVRDLKDCRFAFASGSLIGFLIGVLPGAGSTIASFISYGVEKAVSRRRLEFGTGVVEGVAAPEAANNSETGGALVPLLTLGIPGSSTTAVLLAALVLWGFKPGPLFIPENPALFWGLVASMYIGNVMLLVLNLPLIRLFVKLIDVRPAVLVAAVLVLSTVGVYATNGRTFDLWLTLGFGVLGYYARRADFPAAPAILALVLERAMEDNFRRATTLSEGSLSIFLTRPISAAILALCVLSLFSPYLQAWVLSRRNARAEGAAPARG